MNGWVGEGQRKSWRGNFGSLGSSWRILIDGKLKFKDNCGRQDCSPKAICLGKVLSWMAGSPKILEKIIPPQTTKARREKFPMAEFEASWRTCLGAGGEVSSQWLQNLRCSSKENDKIWIIFIAFLLRLYQEELSEALNSLDSLSTFPIKRRFFHVDCLIRKRRKKNCRREDPKTFSRLTTIFWEFNFAFRYQIKYLFYDFSHLSLLSVSQICLNFFEKKWFRVLRRVVAFESAKRAQRLFEHLLD